jgi:hypothetical protein
MLWLDDAREHAWLAWSRAGQSLPDAHEFALLVAVSQSD